MDRMAELGILVIQQPNFTYTLEGRYREYLDRERLDHNNPLRSVTERGVFDPARSMNSLAQFLKREVNQGASFPELSLICV